MKRIILIISTVAVLISCFAFTAFGAGQEPWNYEDYIHDIEYDDGYNNVLVEIPQWVSYLEVRYRESGVQYWQEKTYGTLLQGRWPSQYSKFSGWFNPIDSVKPLDISNVPNGSLLRVQISLSGFNFDFDGFSMNLYYLDSNYQTLSEVRHWQDYQSYGEYVLDFDIQKPTGARYVCVQCPVGAIFPDSVGGNFQIEFTRTQLVMGIDALYFQQQMTEKNNKLLNEVDRQLQENGQKLDDIIDGKVDSQKPAGSDKIDEFIDAENELLDQTQDGFDQAENIFNEAPGIIALYGSAFFFMSSVIEILATAGWIQGVVIISISLGLIAFIINMTAIVLRNSGKGGGKE